jgi:hypothetical protein
MSDNSSLTQESDNLARTLASVEQITREFDNMSFQLRTNTAQLDLLTARLAKAGPGSNRASSRFATPPANLSKLMPGLEQVRQSFARQDVLGKQLCQAASNFANELVRWTEDLEKRRSQSAEDQASTRAAEARAAEVTKLKQSAQPYLEKAADEEYEADVSPDASGMGKQYEAHQSAANAAKAVAEEMQRRAYILTNANESNYRQLMLEQYGINNPDLDSIAAYYAKLFNDQETLNWLSLQHPAPSPHMDWDAFIMMGLSPEFGIGEEAPETGNPEEESTFERANEAETDDTSKKPANLQEYGGPGGGHHIPAKSAFDGDPMYNPKTAPAIPNAEMENLGVEHRTVTATQRQLYRAYARENKPLTWDVVQDIETKALTDGGMSQPTAAATVSKAIRVLKAAGIKAPTRVPWGGK